MGRSVTTPLAPPGTFTHKKSQSRFRSRYLQGRYVHQVARRGIEAEYPVEFAIGSGTVGQSFAVRIGPWLLESPLSWFSQAERLDISPGFEDDVSPDFDRRIGSECLSCHAANHAGSAVPQPISCEQCHGASGTHFANPAKLPASQRDAVCERCHLQGEARILNPGASWSDAEPAFTTYVSSRPADALKVVSQVEQLALSQCAQQSGGKLWCGTCHNPHGASRPAREVCTGCHTGALSPGAHGQRAAAECVGCHMPKRPTSEVVHAAYTDHFIRRNAQAAFPKIANAPELRAWREPATRYKDRNLGLAYVYAGQRLQSADWIQKGFAILLGIEDKDADVLSALGAVLMQKQLPREAAAIFRKAAALQPQSPEHRHNAAVALLAYDDKSGALTMLEQAVRLDPYYERSWLLAVQIHRAMQRPDLALDTTRRYLRLVPQSLTFRAAFAGMRSHNP